MAVEHMRTLTIGDVAVTRIVELWDFQDNINMTMPEATPEEVIAMRWLHPHYATPDGRQRMNFQGFVIQAPGRVIVVDSCIGAGRQRDFDVFCDLPEGFIEDIESLGISRMDVDTVLCTHLHFDHVGWNTYKDPATGEYKPTFPNARYLFGKTEFDAWRTSATTVTTRHPPGRMRRSDRRGSASPTSSTPTTGSAPSSACEPSHGHTPGHVHVRISSQGRGCGHHRRPYASPDAVRDAAPPGDLRHGP